MPFLFMFLYFSYPCYASVLFYWIGLFLEIFKNWPKFGLIFVYPWFHSKWLGIKSKIQQFILELLHVYFVYIVEKHHSGYSMANNIIIYMLQPLPWAHWLLFLHKLCYLFSKMILWCYKIMHILIFPYIYQLHFIIWCILVTFQTRELWNC